jgi:hypothetical protein
MTRAYPLKGSEKSFFLFKLRLDDKLPYPLTPSPEGEGDFSFSSFT